MPERLTCVKARAVGMHRRRGTDESVLMLLMSLGEDSVKCGQTCEGGPGVVGKEDLGFVLHDVADADW